MTVFHGHAMDILNESLGANEERIRARPALFGDNRRYNACRGSPFRPAVGASDARAGRPIPGKIDSPAWTDQSPGLGAAVSARAARGGNA